MVVTRTVIFRNVIKSFSEGGVINSLPNHKILDWSKLKAFADGKIAITKELKCIFRNGRKHCGKRRKCWFPAFSPFRTKFSKSIFDRGVKSRDYEVKG